MDTGASGNSTTTSFTFSPALPLGQFVTATATDPANNTSEFSNIVCAAVTDLIQVTNTNDSGLGSLRQAILDSNASVGVLNTISFCIPGAGVHTISPTSALNTITDPVVIDGYTQDGNGDGVPDAQPNTLAVGNDAVLLVELNGNGTTAEALTISAGASTVRGLVLNRFSGNAITVQTAGGNTLEGNWMGVSATGGTLLQNGRDIFISNSLNNLVGGTSPAARNVLAGSGSNGALTVFSGASATIQGNYVGMNAQGTAGLGAAGGIDIGTSGNLVGGTAAGAGNVISGTRALNLGAGVAIAANNIVQGNSFGLNANGTTALANNSGGVVINNTATNLAQGNLIGGTTAAGAMFLPRRELLLKYAELERPAATPSRETISA